jgi:squalene-hopene/tetraprenyl-beta-curcumene cyclase
MEDGGRLEWRSRLNAALETAKADLLAACHTSRTGTHWTGELSSSALSTATAVTALALMRRHSDLPPEPGKCHDQIASGLDWLANHVNSDGGWGDTVLSLSNLSTTALCWAAWGAVPETEPRYRAIIQGAERWLAQRVGGLEPERLASAIIQSYGKDRTFSVPILTMCALAGRLGAGREAWRQVIPLPFELAACPQRWFAALRLPVVSYALPALIAIGQARHYHRPSASPIVRLLRNLTRQPTLKVLERIQPANGGFLEATPLTSFVVMSLAGSEEANHPVALRGLEFLRSSQRADGSWPIDTNLCTWLTTLAVNALDAGEGADLPVGSPALLRDWLMNQQYRHKHSYTGAAPGGWAWCDLPGGVPDADDTAGALLALRALGPPDEQTRAAACAGTKWLLDLQNRDGGIPTFCRGWGALPFDRSTPDITAHALRAWLAWMHLLPDGLRRRTEKGLRDGLAFLARSQRADGAWSPLWFGNQFAPGDENLTYGTARVLCALAEFPRRQQPLRSQANDLARRALPWLLRGQNTDGGWGGAPGIVSSVEETALAVEALAAAAIWKIPALEAPMGHGAAWLIERVENGEWKQPAPIGFYFARLWYYERLYPLVFTVSALKKLHRLSQVS